MKRQRGSRQPLAAAAPVTDASLAPAGVIKLATIEHLRQAMDHLGKTDPREPSLHSTAVTT